MPKKLKIGGLTVPEEQADSVQRAIVNKYTLVPLGAVLATALISCSVMWSIMSERERILVLETKVEIIEADTGEQGGLLKSIQADLILIKFKLDIKQE